MHVLIIGTGGVGAMAAWRLARAGHQVTAIEQFRIGHDRGSSYGDSRIIRRVYPDPLYTGLMADSYALWDELQAEWNAAMPEKGIELFCKAGGIFFGSGGHPHVVAAEAALQASGVPFERLDAVALKERFPAFHLPSDNVALYEPSMGYARASDCVYAAASLAKRHGAQIIEANPVQRLESLPDGKGLRVTVETGESFDGERAIITAGAWMGPLLANLGVRIPLTVTRQAYLHLEPSEKDTDLFEVGRFPVWIDAATNNYGFPRLAPSRIWGPSDLTIAQEYLTDSLYLSGIDPDVRERLLRMRDRRRSRERDLDPDVREKIQRIRDQHKADLNPDPRGLSYREEGVPGVKLASHDRGEAVDPETVARTLNAADREKILGYARERLPGLTDKIVYEKVCLYTNTKDEDFVIDTVPGLPGAHFISACSGHGFKFTPLMGQIAADLAVDTPLKYDLSRFRLARFAA